MAELLRQFDIPCLPSTIQPDLLEGVNLGGGDTSFSTPAPYESPDFDSLNRSSVQSSPWDFSLSAESPNVATEPQILTVPNNEHTGLLDLSELKDSLDAVLLNTAGNSPEYQSMEPRINVSLC